VSLAQDLPNLLVHKVKAFWLLTLGLHPLWLDESVIQICMVCSRILGRLQHMHDYNNWEERTITNAWSVVVYIPQWNVSVQKPKVIIYGFLYILEAPRPMENPMAVIQEKVATTQRWCHFPCHHISLWHQVTPWTGTLPI